MAYVPAPVGVSFTTALDGVSRHVTIHANCGGEPSAACCLRHDMLFETEAEFVAHEQSTKGAPCILAFACGACAQEDRPIFEQRPITWSPDGAEAPSSAPVPAPAETKPAIEVSAPPAEPAEGEDAGLDIDLTADEGTQE